MLISQLESDTGMKVKSGLKVVAKLTMLVSKHMALKTPIFFPFLCMSQIGCLYFFICSLSFLADSFRMVGGRSLGGEY